MSNLNEEMVFFSSTEMTPGHQVRVFTSPHNGEVKVHVREYYLHRLTGEYTIGRGMTFPAHCIEEVIQGLILAQEALEKG